VASVNTRFSFSSFSFFLLSCCIRAAHLTWGRKARQDSIFIFRFQALSIEWAAFMDLSWRIRVYLVGDWGRIGRRREIDII